MLSAHPSLFSWTVESSKLTVLQLSINKHIVNTHKVTLTYSRSPSIHKSNFPFKAQWQNSYDDFTAYNSQTTLLLDQVLFESKQRELFHMQKIVCSNRQIVYVYCNREKFLISFCPCGTLTNSGFKLALEESVAVHINHTIVFCYYNVVTNWAFLNFFQECHF